MGKRSRILTSILLSAAMTFSSMTTGFAGETGGSVSEPEISISDNYQAEEEYIESADDSASDDGVETEALSQDEAYQSTDETEGVSDDSAEQEGEVEINSVSEGETVKIEEVEAELNDTVHSYITIENSKEYDGNAFTPKYTVPEKHKLVSENKYNSPALAEAGKTYTFPGIKFVTETQTYFVYPTDASTNEDYDYMIKTSITKRPVTFKSGTYTKEYDGKSLSQDSASGASDPKVVKGSLVGTEKFKFKFEAASKITEPGSIENRFTISENGNTADPNNYDISYEYGYLIVSEKREKINSLPSPAGAKAVVDNKGGVTITWKKVASYKDTGKKGGKTSYKIYRYKKDGTWKSLTDSVTKTRFVDKNPETGEILIYKIIPVGIDSSGVYGEGEEPAYVRVTPKIASASPYDGVHYANVEFMGFGGDESTYVLQHWNNKNKGLKDEVTVTKYNSESSVYKGKTRSISTNKYLDAGGNSVTISGNNKATFTFRVKAESTEVYDYGKKITVSETPWSKSVKLKMVSMSPALIGKRDSNSSFKLKWTSIKTATGYLIEYSKDSSFTKKNTQSVYTSKDDNSKYYNSREYTVKDVGFGVPYYCRVTAYLKKKGDGSEYGAALGTSPVIVQYGRQKAVKNLKAEYYEDGNERCDARLTWSDDEDEKDIKGYYVQRWSYAYNENSKKYDKLTGHEVLQGYTSDNSVKKKYVSTVGGKINNGELIQYRVQSVRFPGGNVGENHDGYVFSEPADFYYMNPSSVDLQKSKYVIKAGNKFTLKPTLKPKKRPKAPAGMTSAEFKELTGNSFEDVFKFNDELEFKLFSDDLTSSEIKKYVTVDADKGELEGIKEYKKTKIKIKVSSPNDPSSVYDTATICIAANGESSSKEKDKESGLVVCIDPGHGGKDDGATYNGIVEKDMNLEIAKKVRDYLKDKGAKVYMTRTDDTYVSLTDRTDYADDKNCNLFVSIHCNSSDSSSSTGTEVYYSVKSDYAKKSLASHISSAVSSALGIKNIGEKTRQGNDGDYYSVIRTSASKGIPGLIVEHAFLSNESDAKALKDSSKLDAAAKAEAEAIIKYWEK